MFEVAAPFSSTAATCAPLTGDPVLESKTSPRKMTLGTQSGAAPLIGAPKCALLPFIEKANSSVTVLPANIAPAFSSFCTVGAVRVLMPDIASTMGLPPPVG